MSNVRWGVHVSADGQTLPALLTQFAKTGMKCLQIFFGNPKSLERKRLSEEDTARCLKIVKENNLALVTHFPYVFNMCDPKLNMGPLQAEISRVEAIGGRVVLHTGSCTAACCTNKASLKASTVMKTTWEADWKQGADVLISHLHKLKFSGAVEYPLLLEPPAGEGNKLGWQLDQLHYIFQRCPKQVGYCMDTCHTFAAGVCDFASMDNVLKFFDDVKVALVDRNRFKLIHLNDSKDPFFSMKDHHEVLKQGHIWSNPDHEEGLIGLFLMAGEFGIDVVSEVGSEKDIKVMTHIVGQIESAQHEAE
jgi:deoxyribonuclease IV